MDGLWTDLGQALGQRHVQLVPKDGAIVGKDAQPMWYCYKWNLGGAFYVADESLDTC